MTENQKLHKQYAFEDYMKTVLRNKARNIHKKLDIQEQREAAASNFDESIFDSLITEDSYGAALPAAVCEAFEKMIKVLTDLRRMFRASFDEMRPTVRRIL